MAAAPPRAARAGRSAVRLACAIRTSGKLARIFRDLRARARTDVGVEPAGARSTTSANEVRTSGASDGPLLVPGEDKRLPDKPATNTAPQTIANPEATAAAGDEIIIGEQRFISERRVAAMLGCYPRTLQRWRTEGKGPPSTKIGRKVVYEFNELQEWIERQKTSDVSGRILATTQPSYQSTNAETLNNRGVVAGGGASSYGLGSLRAHPGINATSGVEKTLAAAESRPFDRFNYSWTSPFQLRSNPAGLGESLEVRGQLLTYSENGCPCIAGFSSLRDRSAGANCPTQLK